MRQLQQAYAISILFKKDVESRQKVKPQTHPPIQTGARDRGRSTQRGSGRGSQRGVDRGGHRGNPRGQGRGGQSQAPQTSQNSSFRATASQKKNN